MAWIETETAQVVNLDNIEYMSICADEEMGTLTLWANGESGHPIASARFAQDSVGRLYRLMVQIAQVARGNAYISQEDIRRMMDESD